MSQNSNDDPLRRTFSQIRKWISDQQQTHGDKLRLSRAKIYLGAMGLLLVFVFAVAWRSGSEQVDTAQVQRLSENLKASPTSELETFQSELLLELLKSEDHAMISLVTGTLADQAAGPKLLETGTAIVAEESWKELAKNALAGDQWAQLFQAQIHLLAVKGRRKMTDFDGLALPDAAMPSYRSASFVLAAGLQLGDREAADRLFKQLADDQHPRGMAVYGGLLETGELGRKDKSSGVQWYTRAANAGDALGSALLGYHLVSTADKIQTNDAGSATSEFEAVAKGEQALLQSVEQGCSQAMYLISYLSETGLNGKRLPEQAQSWRKKAADLGNMSAQIDMTLKLLADISSSELGDVVEAHADNYGDVGWREFFYVRLAEASRFGYILPKNTQQAFVYHRKAADLKSEVALYSLFFAYFNGTGTQTDKPKAWASLEEAARLGHVDAYGLLLYNAETRKLPEAIAAARRLKATGIQLDEVGARTHAQHLTETASRRKDGTPAPSTVQSTKRPRVIGGPPPDIKFGSAKQWHEMYSNAPCLTSSEFLQKVDFVSFRVNYSAASERLIKIEQLMPEVAKTLASEGIRIAPNSIKDPPVTLDLTFELTQYKRTLTEKNSYGFKFNTLEDENSILVVFVKFIVPARIFRDGQFYHREVIPACNFYFSGRGKKYDRSAYLADIKSHLHEIMRTLRKPSTKTTPRERNEWHNTLWNPDKAPVMFQRYMAARQERMDDLERWFTSVNDYEDVEIDLRGKAGDFITSAEVDGMWKHGFRQARLEQRDDSPFAIKHELISLSTVPDSYLGTLGERATRIFYGNIDIIYARQKDVVYEFDGKLLRGDVVLNADFSADIELRKDVAQNFPFHVEKHARSFFKELQYRR